MDLQSEHVTDRAFRYYLHGSLTEPQARAVEQHYLSCRTCNDRMVLLEWFPDAKPVCAPATPVMTISCSAPPERSNIPVLQRALLSARSGFEMLATSEQMLGVSAVASMAILVLSVSLSMMPNNRPIRSEPHFMMTADVFDGSVATRSALERDNARMETYDSDADEPVARRFRPARPERTPFMYAKVFVPPEYMPSIWRFHTSEPVLHAAPPAVTFQVSVPHIPFEAPKLEPPHTSKLKSVLKILSRPFRSEPRNTPGMNRG